MGKYLNSNHQFNRLNISTTTSIFAAGLDSINLPDLKVAKKGKLSTLAIERANSFFSALMSKNLISWYFYSSESCLNLVEINLQLPHQSA
jgi:hypothetical protein